MGFEDKVSVAEALRLVSTVAILLQSVHTTDEDFILEIFLLMDCVEWKVAADAELTVDHNATHLSESADSDNREQRESCALMR